MARSSYPTYVVNGLVLLGNGTPIGDFRGTWNWDGTPEGFLSCKSKPRKNLQENTRWMNR